MRLKAELNEAEALRNFAEAMSVAAECSRQLAFLRQQPHWLAVQNAVLGAREHAMQLARTSTSKLILPPSIAKMM